MCVCVCAVMSVSLRPHGLLAYPATLSMEFSRQEYWGGLPFPAPGNLPNPEIEPGSPALQADSLLTELQQKPNLKLDPFKTSALKDDFWMCDYANHHTFILRN